jgi:sialidase-1
MASFAFQRRRITSLSTIAVTGFISTLLTPSDGFADSVRAPVVLEGKPTANAKIVGNWQQSADGLVGSGLTSSVEATLAVGPGDFTVVARVKVDDVNAVRGGLVIDDVSDFGIATPANPRIYVRGFLFGDITQEISPADRHITAGEVFELRGERRGDMTSYYLNDALMYNIPYTSDRTFGKVAIRAGQANMSVIDFWFEGSTESLEGRLSPYERTHDTLPDSVDVFTAGEDGYHTYRIPAMVVTNAGTILAFAEGRKNSAADHGDVDLVLKRSVDGGRSWEPMRMIYEEGDTERITIGNPVPVVDRNTGTIWLLFCRDNERVFVGHSTDDGMTWSPRREITEHVKDLSWSKTIYTGPGHGVQMASGRLLVPSYHGNVGAGSSSYMIYSDDAGVTWTRGASIEPGTGEPTAAVLSDGRVMMNSRTPNRTWNRRVTISNDGGETWGAPRLQEEHIEIACEGALLDRISETEPQLLLFANPDSHRRERMTVQLSTDNGASWTDKLLIYEGSSAYSDLTQTPDGNFAVLFERDIYKRITFTPFRLSDFPSRQQ